MEVKYLKLIEYVPDPLAGEVLLVLARRLFLK